MNVEDFILKLDKQAGITIKIQDIEKNLDYIQNWDSLTFVYFIAELETQYNIKLDLEKLLTRKTLAEILKVINDEISKNKS